MNRNPRKTTLFLATIATSVVLSGSMVFAQTSPSGAASQSTLPYHSPSGDQSTQNLQKPHVAQGLPQAPTMDPSSHWSSIGPGPFQEAGTTGSPVSGRVTSIAVSESKNGVTVYAGTANGGVWSSNNGGNHWAPLTDEEPSLVTGSVTVDPNNPNVIYAGTGEQDASGDSRYGRGILKSIDGGKSWTSLGADVFGGMHIGKVAVDPFNSSSIWVAADNGLWNSADGGNTWTQCYSGMYDMWSFGHLEFPTDVYLDKHSPGVIYMSMNAGGIYKSTDGGQNFEEMGWGNDGGAALPNWINDVTAPGFHMGDVSFSVVEGNKGAPDTIYTVYTDVSEQLIGMYVSKDGGDTWTQINNVPSYFDLSSRNAGPFDTKHKIGHGYDNVIAVDPTNSNHILAGGVTLLETRDGGQNWTTPSANIHTGQHTITFDSNGDAFIGNDSGVYEETAKGDWRNLNTDLNTVLISPEMSVVDSGHTILAGVQSGGTLLLNGGSQWQQVYGGSGGYTYMDPQNPNVKFIESQNGNIVRRTDTSKDGNNWFASYPGYVNNGGVNLAPFKTPFTVHPMTGKQLGNYELFVGAGCVERSTNNGMTYDAISPNFTVWGIPDPVVALSQSPSDPNVVYAGTTFGQVYASYNAESASPTWTLVTPYQANWDFPMWPDPVASVSAIAINPNNAKEICVTYDSGYWGPVNQSHVFWTADTSVSNPDWRNISANLPGTFGESATYVGNALVVGTEQGVYIAKPGTTAWSKLGSGLPNAPVTSVVDAGNGWLISGTYGRGAFQLHLGGDAKKLAGLQ